MPSPEASSSRSGPGFPWHRQARVRDESCLRSRLCPIRTVPNSEQVNPSRPSRIRTGQTGSTFRPATRSPSKLNKCGFCRVRLAGIAVRLTGTGTERGAHDRWGAQSTPSIAATSIPVETRPARQEEPATPSAPADVTLKRPDELDSAPEPACFDELEISVDDYSIDAPAVLIPRSIVA
jgi:hypothetical protein